MCGIPTWAVLNDVCEVYQHLTYTVQIHERKFIQSLSKLFTCSSVLFIFCSFWGVGGIKLFKILQNIKTKFLTQN